MIARAAEATAAIALLLVALTLGAREIRTPDAYFHLRVGAEILAERDVPRTQRWLAFDRDRPVRDVEWGFEVALAASERAAGGLAGVLALRAALIVIACGAVYGAARRAGAPAAALASGAFIIVAETRFLDAPEMVSIALAALFVAILEARERRPRAVFLLPLLALVWGNAHGFHPLGAALVGCYALGDALHERRFRLVPVLALVAAAPLLNPYGLDGALYALRVARDADFRRLLAERVIELRSPLTDPLLSSTWPARCYQAGLALAAVAVIAPVVSRREGSIGRGFRVERALAIALLAAFSAPFIRNAGLFAAVAAPLGALSIGPAIAGIVARAPASVAAKLRQGSLFGCAALLLLMAWSVAGGAWERDSLDDVGIGARFAPAISHDEALDFYVAHGLPKRLWTDFGTGHAVLARGLQPAICGHTDLYPPALLRAYGDAVDGRVGLDALLTQYPADAILLDHRRMLGSALLSELIERSRGATPDWTLVHLDARDAIWLRSAGEAGDAARRLRFDLAGAAADPEHRFRFAEDREDRDPAPILALRSMHLLPARVIIPRDRLGLAEMLLAMGEIDGAGKLADRAAALLPGWPPCELVLGEIARARGDLDAAKRHLGAAARSLPGNAALRETLGLLHLRLLEYGRAEDELTAALAIEPGNPAYRENLRLVYRMRGDGARADALGSGGGESPAASPEERRAAAIARFNAGSAAAGEGRAREAERLYREAIALDPRFEDPLCNLGNLLFRAGRKEEALLIYREACEVAPHDAEVRCDLAVALRDLGRRDEARAALVQALREDHANARARRALEDLGGSP